jgi:hypothetical protein
MGWERRKRGGRYYTRTKRVGGGRRVRQYVGCDKIAKLAATADALDRADRRARALALRCDLAEWQAASRPLRDLCEQTDLLVRAALIAAGFYLHARGEWRRRRHEQERDRQAG